MFSFFRVMLTVMLIVLCKNVIAAKEPVSDIFTGPEDLGVLENKAITEASGLAASRKNPGVLWTHNDSGDENRVFALTPNGKHLATYYLDGCNARDWEDIAVGPGPEPGESYVYIGDLGDNLGFLDEKQICRFPEPHIEMKGQAPTVTLKNVAVMRIRYPDGSHDAEALMVDPQTKDVYVVTKREKNVIVYRASYPQATDRIITMQPIASLSLGDVVAGDISPSGNELLLRAGAKMYYWSKNPHQQWPEALKEKPVRVPYKVEPQGEAVAWKADGSGYYTTSEVAYNKPAHIYFYTRNKSKKTKMGKQ